MAKQRVLDMAALKPGEDRNPYVLKPRPIKNVSGVEGTLPMKQGDFGEITLTPEEEEALKKFGWEPGMLVPGDLAQQISNLREEQEEETRTLKPKPDDFKPNIPATIDISELSADKRAKIEQYIKDFQTMVPMMQATKQAELNMAQLTPGVQKALTAAQQKGIEIYDSRVTSPASTIGDLQVAIDKAEGKTSRLEPTTGLEEDKPSDPESSIDPIDKAVFLTCVASLKPFEKTYSLMGGRVQLKFKQLDATQHNAIMREIAYKAKNHMLAEGEGLYLGQVYRMLLSLVSIKTPDGEIVMNDLMNSYMQDSTCVAVPSGTLLTNMPEYMEKQPGLAQLWNLCLKTSVQFGLLVETLEDKATDPDFWEAIGG